MGKGQCIETWTLDNDPGDTSKGVGCYGNNNDGLANLCVCMLDVLKEKLKFCYGLWASRKQCSPDDIAV